METINNDKNVDEAWGFYVDIESTIITNNDNYKLMTSKHGLTNYTFNISMDDNHIENEPTVNISGCNFCCSNFITLLFCSYFVFCSFPYTSFGGGLYTKYVS